MHKENKDEDASEVVIGGRKYIGVWERLIRGKKEVRTKKADKEPWNRKPLTNAWRARPTQGHSERSGGKKGLRNEARQGKGVRPRTTRHARERGGPPGITSRQEHEDETSKNIVHNARLIQLL